MQLTEKHIIDRKDPRYTAIDNAAFASKNLYNATLYIVRQVFIGEGEYLNYNTMDQIMQKHETYRGLPTKVAQEVVKQVHEAWISYFEACKEYREHPEKFTGRPKLPGYKDKTKGRNLLQYNMQAVSRGKKTLDRGIIKPSQLGITVKTKQNPKSINEVRIAPKKGFYVVEVVYDKEGIGVLVIGKNDGWKQNMKMGKQNNQNFCQIPHAKLIDMLRYKAE